jgi:hypothetical protein
MPSPRPGRRACQWGPTAETAGVMAGPADTGAQPEAGLGWPQCISLAPVPPSASDPRVLQLGAGGPGRGSGLPLRLAVANSEAAGRGRAGSRRNLNFLKQQAQPGPSTRH